MTGTGLVAKQPADEVTGTGLEAKQPADEVTGTGLVAKQPADEVGRPLALFKEVGGGSAVVLATRKASSELPYCLPPNLSPLPVSVHTHSLNLSKIQFSPNLFFCFIFIFYFPSINSSP